MKKDNKDLQLISKILNGDIKLFRVIVDKYKSKVASTVKTLLGDTGEAEEVGLEVFIKLYNNLNKYKGESKLETYIIRIAINLSYNELKKRDRKRTIFSNNTTDNDYIKELGYDNQSETDNKALVKLALEKLEIKDRAIINLRLMQGFTNKESAEILRIPLGTVLSRFSRAQNKIKLIITELLK